MSGNRQAERSREAFVAIQATLQNNLQLLDTKITCTEDCWEREEGGGGKTLAFSDGSIKLMENLSIRAHTLGSLAMTGAVLAATWFFFRYTRLGLALRAAADNQESSRLVGINVSFMLALGWGLAAGIGAIAVYRQCKKVGAFGDAGQGQIAKLFPCLEVF